MNWLYKFKKQIIIILLSIVALMLVFILIIIPTIKLIIAINEEIYQQEDELKTKLALGFDAKKIKKELETAEKQLQELNKIFITKENELEIINDLESLAKNNQVEISIKSDFKQQTLNNNINKLPLSITVSGSYPQLISFIRDLDCQKYYYNIDNFNLIKITNKNYEVINLTLVGNFFIKK